MGDPSLGPSGLPLRCLSSELLSAGWPSRLLRQVEGNACLQTTALPNNLGPSPHRRDTETNVSNFQIPAEGIQLALFGAGILPAPSAEAQKAQAWSNDSSYWKAFSPVLLQ